VEGLRLPLNQIPEFFFEVVRDCKGPKMTQKNGEMSFYRKMPMVMPRPLLHPFLAPSNPVLTNGRCTKNSSCSHVTWQFWQTDMSIFFCNCLNAWYFLQNKSNSEWVKENENSLTYERLKVIIISYISFHFHNHFHMAYHLKKHRKCFKSV
jgi:hypothetical protein